MRLLNVHTGEFRDFHGDRIPPYVVTSHRWSSNESTYKDVLKKKNPEREGYQKILRFCAFARQVFRDPKSPEKPIDWIWIDTCCINQNSSAEVSESINSMWSWYSQATHCIAHLKDVRSFTSGGGQEGVLFDFRKSEWFERGWTLQELLAPQCVVFVTHNWEVIGRKSPDDHACTVTSTILNDVVAEVTGIPKDVLCGFESRRAVISKEMKMAWAANRQTTKVEDAAYCLFGIFGVHMPLIYGEGERNARRRLEQEIRNKEREDDLDFDAPIHHQNSPSAAGSTSGPVITDFRQTLRNNHMEISGQPNESPVSGSCPVCESFMIDPVSTSCGHTLCDSCVSGQAQDKFMFLFEPLDSKGKPEGDAAVRNFGYNWRCPVCGTQAYVWYNSLLAQQLQREFPATHLQRSAEVNMAMGDSELINISIGNWHELVGQGAHRWTFFVKPSRTDIVDMVYIQLHESFQDNQDNLLRRPPYTIHGQGWGYFAIKISVVLKAGYVWISDRAADGPYGAPNARLKLWWTLDFESHNGKGSMGRCKVKVKRDRGR